MDEERIAPGAFVNGDYGGALGRPQRARAQPLPLKLDANARMFDEKFAKTLAFGCNGSKEAWIGRSPDCSSRTRKFHTCTEG